MSDTMIIAYQEAFPESKLCFLSPSGDMTAVDLDNNKEYVKPFDETEEVFIDRIRRSKEKGCNLFFEEWPPLVHEWETDLDVKL
ncbi:MAG: hypothetical protein E7337_17190 [Clostridiales bacterium]|nr:hypothetical protein [Clostridiales bacterium]